MTLSQRIKAEQLMLKKVGDPGCGTHLTDSFISYRIRKAFSGEYEDDPEWAREFFLISEPMDPILGSAFIHEKESVTLPELIALSIRLVRIIQELSRCGLGVHLGAFDLNTLYVSRNGGHDPTAKSRLVNGSLLYGAMEAGLPQFATVPGTAHEAVRAGKAQTLDTDLYALGAFLWALSGGADLTGIPDLDTPPRYAPDALTEVLRLCMEGGGETVLREVHTRLRDLERSLRNDPDAQEVKIPLALPLLSNAEEGTSLAAAAAQEDVSLGESGSAMFEAEERDMGNDTPQYAAEAVGEPAAAGEREKLADSIVQPENSNDPISYDGGGNAILLGSDPMLEGMEIVELSFDDIADDGIDLELERECAGEETVPERELPGGPQRAPLAPRRRAKQDVREDKVESKPLRNKILIPIVAVMAVIVVSFGAGHLFNRPEEPVDNPGSSVAEQAPDRDQTQDGRNPDQNQDPMIGENEPFQDGDGSYPDGMTEAEWAAQYWDDDSPNSLVDRTGESSRGDINTTLPKSTTTVLPKVGGATKTDKKTDSSSDSNSKSDEKKNSSSNIYYVGNNPVKNNNQTASNSSGNAGNAGSASNTNNKTESVAPGWLGATSGRTPTQWVHPVLPPVQTGSPSASSSQDGVFSVYPTSLSLTQGESAQLTTTDRCILRSNNPSVASINGGRIIGVG